MQVISYFLITLKEHLRRVERKNRDEFRKVLEEHANDGTITAKTHWRDYCLKVLPVLIFSR